MLNLCQCSSKNNGVTFILDKAVINWILELIATAEIAVNNIVSWHLAKSLYICAFLKLPIIFLKSDLCRLVWVCDLRCTDFSCNAINPNHNISIELLIEPRQFVICLITFRNGLAFVPKIPHFSSSDFRFSDCVGPKYC